MDRKKSAPVPIDADVEKSLDVIRRLKVWHSSCLWHQAQLRIALELCLLTLAVYVPIMAV